MAMTIDMRGRTSGRPVGGTAGTAERARAFRIAGRHTVLVRTLRVALPILAVGICGLYALTLGRSLKIGSGRLDVGQIELTPDDLTMKNPRYYGKGKDGGRYEVHARRAILELSGQGPIKLIDIDGNILQTNNTVTKLKAKHGLLDNNKGELELFDGIEIDASNGMTARMQRAMIYQKENRVVSKHPVEMTMPTGTVRGATMTMKTDTREATLVGDVAVRLLPSAQPGQTTAGFGRDPKQPVDIVSQHFYLNDTTHTALFTGSVVATQGDTILKTPDLRVIYEGKAADQLMGPTTKADAKGDAKGGESGSRLSRMVASKGAVITAGTDRKITAELADFDAKADTALFTGNVVVNQQKNVLQGRRMFVDRKNNKSRLDSPAEGGQPVGRITATFYQTEGRPQPTQAKTKTPQAELAETAQGAMFGGFKMDPDAPMDIEANTLDIFDATRQAIFRTNVHAKQGDVTIRTVELIAYYSGSQGAFSMGGTDDKGQAQQSQLTRVEAKQKVLITSKDGQSATGDSAIFDVKANTVLLIGHVVVTRGKDIAEGPRLKIDLTTGMYRFEVDEDTAKKPPVPEVQKPVGPAVSSTQPETPTARSCPPGKQCLLFFPQEAKERAKGLVKDAPKNPVVKELLQPSTSGSSVIRGD